jgi:hypothetical protein
MLRKVSLPLALGVLVQTQAASATAAAPLVEATIEASLSYVKGNSAACSADAVRLAQSEVLAMTSSVAPVSATLVALIALGAGIALSAGDATVQGDANIPLSAATLSLAAADVEAPAGEAGPFAVDPQTDEPQSESGRPSTATDEPAADSDSSDKPALDLFTHSEGERRILTTLKQPLRDPFDYTETPLSDIALELSETYNVPILFDVRALEAVATSPDVEVSLTIANVPLRSALRLMLNQIENLTYVVRDDVLMITTEEVADSTMETHVYDVSDMVESVTDLPELKAAIVATVEPDTWQETGKGPGTISTLKRSMLVVHQTQSVHEEIEKFLGQLEALKNNSAKN